MQKNVISDCTFQIYLLLYIALIEPDIIYCLVCTPYSQFSNKISSKIYVRKMNQSLSR